VLTAIKNILPGTVTSVVVGLVALFLSQYYAAPSMLFALLLGIAMSFLYQQEKCIAGIEFTACHTLRIGVALLGFRIALSDLVTMGWKTTFFLIIAITSTIFLGVFLARLLGLQKRFGMLTGGAVGICGASAALAISAVLPEDRDKDRDTSLTIIGVTSLSTIAMLAYPIAAKMLGLDESQTGVFLGATIHDVAQVVGAGYSVSEQTGDLAILTKLIRVAFLMPVVVCILLLVKLKFTGPTTASAPGFPGFLIAFVVFMLVNSTINIPEQISAIATDISQFCLVIAIAAIGMKSNISQITQVGIKPIILIVVETLWIAVLVLACIWFV
jgi:uncharacterized integral membrane protein (TIGR00698 family)